MLRTYLLTGFFLISFSPLLSQNQRIAEIDAEIKEAVERKDFDEAAILKQEKELWIQIDSAVANENFEKAADIQRQIEQLGDESPANTEKEENPKSGFARAEVRRGDEMNLSTTETTKGIVPPSKGKSAVYFVITGSSGGMVPKYECFADQHYIGYLKAKKYIRYECDPGEHLFWISSENKEFLTAELLADEIYIVRVEFTTGAFKSHPGFRVEHSDKQLAKAVKLIEKKESLSFDRAHLEEENEKFAGFIRSNLERYEKKTKDVYNFRHLAADDFYRND